MPTKPILLSLFLISSFFTGCSSFSSVKDKKVYWSAGSVPCLRRDIIANDDPIHIQRYGGPSFFRIICHNVEYECVKHRGYYAACTPQVILEKR